ncbi:hypothetical protein KM043_015253 [Ampulex compressa]|nr:hypothetical protein KM043_015253 [Ampulex compressa]
MKSPGPMARDPCAMAEELGLFSGRVKDIREKLVTRVETFSLNFDLQSAPYLANIEVLRVDVLTTMEDNRQFLDFRFGTNLNFLSSAPFATGVSVCTVRVAPEVVYPSQHEHRTGEQRRNYSADICPESGTGYKSGLDIDSLLSLAVRVSGRRPPGSNVKDAIVSRRMDIVYSPRGLGSSLRYDGKGKEKVRHAESRVLDD